MIIELPEARKAGKAESNASVFSYFVERCKTNIHIVLCMSPIGAGFRTRLRQFPVSRACSDSAGESPQASRRPGSALSCGSLFALSAFLSAFFLSVSLCDVVVLCSVLDFLYDDRLVPSLVERGSGPSGRSFP
jgi:hypothetical protein